MAWMSDEKYTYIQDCKEKKSTAASAFKQKTHCGKGGRVKLPSDYMSKKELKAMNGECKSYRLNDPMSWEEFKAMPDDLKVCYIKGLREKYKVPDAKLAAVWGVAPPTFGKWTRMLGLSQGKGAGAAGRHWYNTDDCDRFNAWWHGVKLEFEEAVENPSVEPVEAVEQKNVETTEVREEVVEAALSAIGEAAATVFEEMDNGTANYSLDVLVGKTIDTYPDGLSIPCAGPIEIADKSFTKYAERVDRYAQSIGYDSKCDYASDCREKMIRDAGPIAFAGHHMPVIPKNGTMTFEHDLANDALDTIKCLLSNMRVNLTISWECVFEDGVVCER